MQRSIFRGEWAVNSGCIVHMAGYGYNSFHRFTTGVGFAFPQRPTMGSVFLAGAELYRDGRENEGHTNCNG